jgi:pimeloyl-ACP methyl ester carboxylesterase
MATAWRRVGPPGRRGRCLTLGEGENVVLLASPLARGECYVPTAERLAARCRAHLFEMPGSGTGTRLESPLSLEGYADWAAEAVKEQGLRKPAVIGHSYSGMVAVALAARHPDRCGALVVADSPGAGEPASLWRGLAGAAADALLDLGLVAAMWPYVAGNALAHRRNFLAMIRESLSADVTGLARRVAAPSLVAWGAMDHTIPPRAAEALAACLPASRRYFSPGGSHTWVVSQPEEFARAVAAFLAPARR